MPEYDDTIEAIFDRARREEDAAKREAYLERACGEDTALRSRVDALLAAEDQAEDFLEPDRDQGVGSRVRQDLDTPGTSIGPYRLLQQIGEGGFGVVYMAEQRTPVVRKVALKIIKMGMDTKQVIARFEAERQALALMDHPNIARVLDAGATKTGRPYFVMELVKGVPIMTFCDQHRLSMKQRLSLFMDVCSAVQHAHQKGIIHRDLKPSNILISLHEDEQPLPKVIDFGIAKATQHRLTEKTLFTEFRQMIGTPAYMSPEQMQFSGLDIDTRSDIYSLGVLLYELLTGKTPFDSRELLSKGYDEICRCIREDEPPRPSTRWSTLAQAEQSTHAETRRAAPAELGRLLRGDLDWIVMKALEKDRRRRYDTANSLRLDVGRFLDDEPVSAVAPSGVYRLRKLVRRHKATFAALAVVAASLTLGLGLSIYAFAKERAANREAQIRFQEAEAARHDAEAARREADEGRQAAEDARRAEAEQRKLAQSNARRARKLQYASDMRLAQNALAQPDVRLAASLLDSHNPSDGMPDLRGWEWRFLKGQLRQEKNSVKTHSGISRIALSTDGELLAVAGKKQDETIAIDILDTKDLSTVRSIGLPGQWAGDMCCSQPDRPTGWVSGMFFSKDKRTLVVERNENKGVILFDLENGESFPLVPQATDRPVPLWPAKLSPDQKWLIGMYDVAQRKGHVLYSFEVETGRQHAASQPLYVADPDRIDHHMQISPDGRLLCISCRNDTLRVFTLPELQESLSIQGEGKSVATAWSPDSRVIAVGYQSPHRVDLWDSASGRQLDSLTGAHTGPIVAIRFSPDGRLLATADFVNTVVVWDLKDTTEPKVFRGHTRYVNSIQFFPDGKTLATAGVDGSVMLWDISERQTDLARLSDEVTLWQCQYSPDGRSLATNSPNGVVRLFDARTEELLKIFTPDHIGDVSQSDAWSPLCFSPDGHTLVAGNGDRTATAYDVLSGKRRFPLAGHSKPLIHIRYSPDGKTIASTGEENGLILWDASTGDIRRSMPGPGGPRWIDFCPDPNRDLLAYRGKDCFALWDLETDKTHLRNATENVWSVDFSPDGKTLAVSVTGEVRLYSVPALALLATLPGSFDAVTNVAFSPDGLTLAVPSWTGFVQLWSMRAMADVGRLPVPQDLMLGADFSPDGRTIAVSTQAHGVHQFRAPTLADIAAHSD